MSDGSQAIAAATGSRRRIAGVGLVILALSLGGLVGGTAGVALLSEAAATTQLRDVGQERLERATTDARNMHALVAQRIARDESARYTLARLRAATAPIDPASPAGPRASGGGGALAERARRARTARAHNRQLVGDFAQHVESDFEQMPEQLRELLTEILRERGPADANN